MDKNFFTGSTKRSKTSYPFMNCKETKPNISRNKMTVQWSPRDTAANELDCNIEVTEFEFQSRYYIYFWTWEMYE